MHKFRMRVQLQHKKSTESVSIVSHSAIMVMDVHLALDGLTVKASKSQWFPSRALRALKTAVDEMKFKVQQYPPRGTPINGAGNIARREFVDNKVQYRIDLENHAGRNLTS